jgi:hypothetical protein
VKGRVSPVSLKLLSWNVRWFNEGQKCLRVGNAKDQFSQAFASIYGPNANCDRRLLWDELASLLSWWNLPWCIVCVLGVGEGDFNVTQFPSDQSFEDHEQMVVDLKAFFFKTLYRYCL